MKKTLIAMLIVLMVLGVASPALAAGTPTWWVPGNPPKGHGGPNWNYSWASGSVVNETGDQLVTVLVDVQVPNQFNSNRYKLVWAQAEWTPTGLNAAKTFPVTPQITYSNDPCPQIVGDALTNPIGPFLMRPQGAGTPDPAHQNPGSNPPNLPYTSMNEYSYGYDSTPPEANPPGIIPQPACERIEFKFQVGANSQADWRVEVQTLCLTPTAITLRNLQAENTVASLPMLGLVGVPLITVSLLGGNTLLRRKHETREKRP